MKQHIKILLRESLNLENHINEIKDELDFSSFKINDTLQPDIWVDGKINEEYKERMLKIANDYWDSLGLGFEYDDITLTGSLANYNSSKYSDVDLHIVYDEENFRGEDFELIQELLDTKTRKWNSDHDIKIKGFEVELYLQPLTQEHHSKGVYSLSNDEWIIEPKKEKVEIDKETVTKKYNTILNTLSDIEKSSENQIEKLDKLKEKVKKMRKSGLESKGEFSTENIVYKLLRRNEIMKKISDLTKDIYDKKMTIIENQGKEVSVNFLKQLDANVRNKSAKKMLAQWISKGKGLSKVKLSANQVKMLEIIKKGGPKPGDFWTKN
jgi:hypothetical protein